MQSPARKTPRRFHRPQQGKLIAFLHENTFPKMPKELFIAYNQSPETNSNWFPHLGRPFNAHPSIWLLPGTCSSDTLGSLMPHRTSKRGRGWGTEGKLGNKKDEAYLLTATWRVLADGKSCSIRPFMWILNTSHCVCECVCKYTGIFKHCCSQRTT